MAERRQQQARERAAYERERYGAPSVRSAPFAKYSKGGGAAADLHLAEFGEEAEDGNRTEAQATIEGYLEASAASEWERACGYLARETRSEVEKLAVEGGQPASCPEALPKFISIFGSGAGKGVVAPEGIASLRVEEGGRAGEGAGFVLLHGSDGADYWMAVKRQGGSWNVLSASLQPFG